MAGDDPGYLVEVKSRGVDEALTKFKGTLSPPLTKSMHHDAKVREWLAESKQQFLGLDRNHERLWFLWCSMDSPFDGGYENQFERTLAVLYGMRRGLEAMPPHRDPLVFYAASDAYFDFPEIDGSVVISPSARALTLCPNESSPRFERVMKSNLVSSMRSKGVAITLPDECSRHMGAYVVPKELRRAPAAMIQKEIQKALEMPYLTLSGLEEEFMQAVRIPARGTR